jgi:hypothetical protein
MPNKLLRLCAFAFVCVISGLTSGGALSAEGDYPLTLLVDARAKTETTTITSIVTIHVDRLMEESRRKRVADALKHGGYPTFLPALRALPAIGAITLEKRMVDLKYAQESRDEKGRRLVLVADRPLFFLGNEQAKARAGYELTVVDLRFDAKGGVTGSMMGAARVKPTGDGGVDVDDYTDLSVQLTVRPVRP